MKVQVLSRAPEFDFRIFQKFPGIKPEIIIMQNSLQKAKIDVAKENPDLPMKLKFEVSTPQSIETLLKVKDLTLPSQEGEERNIIGIVFEQVVKKLNEANFPNVTVVRGGAVVSVADNFDNLMFPAGNPGRASTYTRYTDGNHLLRTHITSLVPSTFREVRDGGAVVDNTTFVFPGLAYRRDVIDPKHLDVFHQIDIWTLQSNQAHGVTNREALLKLVKVVFDAACPNAEMIVLEAKHPYTTDGIEVYAKMDGKEIEVLEAGLVHPTLLKLAGLDPNKYSGLALGMGLERLIMARKQLPDIRLIRSTDTRVKAQMMNMEVFKNVSNMPPLTRDMSYCVDRNETEEDICEEIRDVFGENADLLEQVEILKRTPYAELEDIAKQRLGASKNQDNVLIRITLRHPDKTLTKKEGAGLYDTAYPKLHKGQTIGYIVKK